MEIRHILAPTDFSDSSNQAVTYAFGLAQACGAKLSLLHVVEPLASPLDGYIPPDLIVMATRGRTGLSHLVLGSVAERVVRLAPCPVLTVRATA